MSTDQATEQTTDQAAEKAKVVFDTLAEAVVAAIHCDKLRIYRVKKKQGAVEKPVFVMSTSPAQAALLVIGEDKVDLVGIKERYDAGMAAFAEARKAAQP